MSKHNYITFGCQSEHDEKTLDVFAKVRGEHPLKHVNIVMMPRLSLNDAQRIIAAMVREGLLAEYQENGKTLYALTEKGEQLAEETKREWLEETHG